MLNHTPDVRLAYSYTSCTYMYMLNINVHLCCKQLRVPPRQAGYCERSYSSVGQTIDGDDTYS